MATEVLTIRVQPQMKANLDSLGKSLHRTKSYIVERAIEEYIERNSWQIAELYSANNEIEKEEFVSNKEVTNYLNSW